jgi:hypothetical protein
VRLRSKLSFANVISMIALFVALGGAAYAGGLINGAKLKPNSVKGRQVKEASLALVCPSGATSNGPTGVASKAVDVCFGPEQAGSDWDLAARDCASDKLRLPSIAEALLVTNKVTSPYIWTDEFTTAPNSRMVIRTDDTGFSRIADNPKTGPFPYRCVSSTR